MRLNFKSRNDIWPKPFLQLNATVFVSEQGKIFLLSKTCQDLNCCMDAIFEELTSELGACFTMGFSNYVLQKGLRHMINISLNTILVP